MRPRRLVLEGFGPYKRRQELDFTQLDLFAICGPTGAGKSSLVDALTYALYGRIYRVGDDVKSFISLDQGTERPRMVVELEFEADGRIYRVVRITGTKSPAQTQLEEFRDGQWHALEGRVKEANERIQRIVGLDFDAFTKSVVLPQNEFHRFLAGKPEERRQILDQLLSLKLFSDLHQRANQEARRCDEQATFIRRQLETTYASATPERLEEVRRALQDANARLADRQDAVKTLEAGHELAVALRQADEARATAEARCLATQSRVSQLEAQLKEDTAALAPLQQELERLQQELEATAYDAVEHQRLIKAEGVASTLERALADERTWNEQVQKGQAKLAQDEAAESAAARALEEADRRVEEARAALDQAKHHDMAATLRSGLRPGDPCPVCGQPVTQVPGVEASHLDAAAKELREAEAAAKRAHDEYKEASRRFADTRAKLTSAQEQLELARGRVAQERANLANLVGEARASSLDAKALRAELEEHERRRAKRESLGRSRAETEQALNARKERLAGAKGQLAEAKDSLAGAQRDLDAAKTALNDARTAMAEWIERSRRSDLAPLLERASDLAKALENERKAVQQALEEIRVEIARTEQEEKTVRDAIEQAKGLREHESALTARGRLARELAYHLQADRLPAFIRGEALRALAADGSERLSFLSAGRYTLKVSKQEFQVVDHWNAGEQRPVKTLSGGETFLASLALALALAERIPELAAGHDTRLESLFLDEGFGALDAETLEVAGRALDALRSEERLVGVITHVEELADRLPARVRVIKEPEGSRLEIA